MKKYSVSTPEGTRDKLFSECSLRRELTNSLKALFSRRGYQEVITPSVEYYDVFLDSGTPLEPESMLKADRPRRQNFSHAARCYDADRADRRDEAFVG